MVFSYVGRNIDITSDMKEYFEKKCKKIKFYFEQIIKIDLIVETERGKYNVELKVSATDDVFFAKASSKTWMTALNSVVSKVVTEIKKKRDKITEHRK